MRTLCRSLVILSLISTATRADDISADGVALGDLVIQGLDAPVRLRIYATLDDVPWRDYGATVRTAQLQTLFGQLDANADGRLTPDEAKRLPRPGTLGRTGRAPGVNVAFNFRVLDADGSGDATLAELQAYLEEYSQPTESVGFVALGADRNPGDLFAALDADHNRRLVPEEWSDVARLLERDRDGNRVVTPDELRNPSSELFGPEFVAIPSASGSRTETSLTATFEPATADEPDGVIRLRISDAATGPAGIVVHLHERLQTLGVTVVDDASPRVRLRIGRRFVDFAALQAGPRGSAAVGAALLRQFDAMAETLARPLTVDDSLPAELRSAFSVADANGDGNLERAELELCIAGYIAATANSTASRLTVMFVPERRGLSPLIDANRDGRLSLREIQRLPEQMELLVDGQQTIGLNELPSVAAVVFCRGIAPEAADAALLANAGPDWFVRADRNADGDLDGSEFMGPPEVFVTLDTNNDGWIELDEALRLNDSEAVPMPEAVQ